MIKKLDNTIETVAKQIFTTFQSSYKVEAQLIGALNFPPLSRSAQNIQDSTTLFYGFSEQDCLAAVIEIAVNEKHLDIHSLTVKPQHFRKGIADKLLEFVLQAFDCTYVIVETAVANKPAIRLYKKHGFVEIKTWFPSHGIEKVAMAIHYDID